MKRNRSKKILLAALAGLLIFAPAQGVYAAAGGAVQALSAHDSRLSEFDIAPGTLNPAFSPDILEYTAQVDAGVTQVQVRAVPRASASGGTIASVEGSRNLQPGVNTIKVTCSAPDYSYSVYTITLTVGSADAGNTPDQAGGTDNAAGTHTDDTGSDAPGGAGNTPDQAGNAPDNAQDTPDQAGNTPDDGENQTSKDSKGKSKNAAAKLMGPVAADGSVTLNGAAYKLSNDFSYSYIVQDIPSAFGEGSVQIGENSYSTLYYEASGIHLVYMENTDGGGSTGFYYYDEMQNAVERFKYTGIGENFVVFISNARAELPAGYEPKTLKLPSGKKTAAYQNTASEEMQDYYLIYGINSDGSNGWYLYDNAQGTYMRYVQTSEPEEEAVDEKEAVEHTVSLKKYSSLKDKYTELKNNMVKAVSALTIALLLIIMVFTAILLRGRDDEDEEETDGEEQERGRVKKRPKAKKQPEVMSKSSLAAGRVLGGSAMHKKAKKVTKTVVTAPEEGQERQPAGNEEHISTPEEIRAQMSREQEQRAQMSREQERRAQISREQEQRARISREQELRARAQQAVQPEAYEQPAARTMARTGSAELNKERDPMDDWEVEEAPASRKSKFHKKKRSLIDEDMEVMDLNDL